MEIYFTQELLKLFLLKRVGNTSKIAAQKADINSVANLFKEILIKMIILNAF